MLTSPSGVGSQGVYTRRVVFAVDAAIGTAVVIVDAEPGADAGVGVKWGIWSFLG